MAKRNLQYETVETVQLTPLQEQNVINILVLIKEIEEKNEFFKPLGFAFVDEELLASLLKELRIVETQITLNTITSNALTLFEPRYKNTIFLDINILKSYICYTRDVIARDLFPLDEVNISLLAETIQHGYKMPKEKDYSNYKDFLIAEDKYFERGKMCDKIKDILLKIKTIQFIARSVLDGNLPTEYTKTDSQLDMLPYNLLFTPIEIEKIFVDFFKDTLYVFRSKYFALAFTKTKLDEYKEWSRIHKERFNFLYSFTKETYTNLGLNLPDDVIKNIFTGLINNSFIDKDSDWESFRFLMKGGTAFPQSFTPINFLETKYCGLFFYCISHFYYDDANVKWNNFIHFIHSKGKKITKKTAGNTKNIAGNKVVAYERGETSLDKNEKSVYNLLETVLKKR